MKIVKFVCILFSALTTVLNAKNLCLRYGTFPEGKRCVNCFKSRPMTEIAGCADLTQGENCDMAIMERGKNFELFCAFCSEGYAYYRPADFESNCVRITPIENCKYHIIDTATNSTKCLACLNGTGPSSEEGNLDLSCDPLQKPIENCEFHTRSYGTEYRCYKCKDGLTVASDFKSCVALEDSGCHVDYNGTCVYCNGWAGYEMGQDGKCFKA